MFEIIFSVSGIPVTVISIIVAVISIRQNAADKKHAMRIYMSIILLDISSHPVYRISICSHRRYDRMEKKAVFLDIDGTMVDYGGVIPPSTTEALDRAKARGHKLVICTGRSRFQLDEKLLSLGFSGIVGAAGAFVDVDGAEIYHTYIDKAHRKSSFDYLEEHGFTYCYQADDGVYLNAHSRDGMIARYRSMGIPEEGISYLLGQMHVSDEPWRHEKNEKIIYHNAPFSVAKVNEDLAPYFDTVAISINGMGDDAGEIGIGGINKATGMELYLMHVGIAREDSIALGDGPNDLQMMEYAGIGVAMGNALDDVKQRADLMTKPIGEDGLYLAFEQLGLI